MPQKLTAEHVTDFQANGLIIVHDFLPESERAAIAADIRACMAPWDTLKDNPPAHRSAKQGFPYPTLTLNRFFATPDILWFARQVLGTHDIQYRNGFSLTRYPGEMVGTNQGWHIDNGNNSLLPESEDTRHGQVVVWYWPEEVRADQAPMCAIPKPFENDRSKQIMLAVPANTLFVMTNYTWHSGSDFTGTEGQRYSHAGMFGRADCPWEGLQHYTNQGMNKQFRELISSLTPDERTVFRFPPPGHAYYTPKTLRLLEAQYPGFNATGAYG